MDFTLTETQKEYQEKARRLAVERLAPKYQEREKRGFVEKDLQIEMGKLGLIAPEIPEDLGGRGLDCVTDGIIVEEIARGDFNVSYVQIVGSLVGQILSGYARPEVTAARAGRGQAGRRSGIQADLRTGLELEAQGIALLFGTEDQVEGMSAFLEKREAKCTGE